MNPGERATTPGRRIAAVGELVGVTLASVVRGFDPPSLTFTAAGNDRRVWFMAHEEDTREEVSIEDVDGDLDSLIGAPIHMAAELTQKSNIPLGSLTFTFYRFATAKGCVTIRWTGESNGYYSEAVDFWLLNP